MKYRWRDFRYRRKPPSTAKIVLSYLAELDILINLKSTHFYFKFHNICTWPLVNEISEFFEEFFCVKWFKNAFVSKMTKKSAAHGCFRWQWHFFAVFSVHHKSNCYTKYHWCNSVFGRVPALVLKVAHSPPLFKIFF